MWKIAKHYGLPDRTLKIFREMYTNTTCHVIHNNELSEGFEVDTGVRQGCILSPFLFSLVIDWVLKTTTREKRGIQWTMTTHLEDLDFADDISLISHSHAHMQAKTTMLQNTAATVGLHINKDKTKTIRINARNQTAIQVEGQPVEEVQEFTYLGSIVSKTGGTDEDVKSRIVKARQAFAMLRPVWKNKNIHLKTKLMIFNSNVKSVLLYGSETWRQTKALQHKTQVFINKCLRRLHNIHWPEIISNEELWRRSSEEPISQQIKRRKWRWVGHCLRRGPENIARHSLDWNPQGKRSRGRPRITWRRTLTSELKEIKLAWSEAKRRARDRDGWRGIVSALCSSRNTKD